MIDPVCIFYLIVLYTAEELLGNHFGKINIPKNSLRFSTGC